MWYSTITSLNLKVYFISYRFLADFMRAFKEVGFHSCANCIKAYKSKSMMCNWQTITIDNWISLINGQAVQDKDIWIRSLIKKILKKHSNKPTKVPQQALHQSQVLLYSCWQHPFLCEDKLRPYINLVKSMEDILVYFKSSKPSKSYCPKPKRHTHIHRQEMENIWIHFPKKRGGIIMHQHKI